MSVLGAIPNILPLDSKGNGRSVRVQMMQEPFQEFSEIREIGMLVQLQQPANHRDNGVGVDIVRQVFHFLVET